MAAKRSLAEAELDTDTTTDTLGNSSTVKIEPYTTYFEAHSVLVSLRNNQKEDHIRISSRRALVTAQTPTLPSAVQQVAVRLVAQLCTHPVVDSISAVVGLVSTLKTAEPSVRCEIYQALAALHELKGIFSTAPLPDATLKALSDAMLDDLNHSQHHLRCSSLAILPMVRPQIQSQPIAVFETVCRYTADAHPKVRQTALGAILREYMMGAVLPVEMYDECVVATKDDFEQVRLVAVELVWAISSSYPEYPVLIQKYKVTETIRLLDDAFVKTCDMVNDSSVLVRQRACTILGRFKNVDNKFLSQTFSKQVMSNLRRFVPKAGHTRGYTGRNKGVRNSQSRAFIPTPEGDADVESDEFRLLDSGAAGAFVHGLEDEYQEVRDAAIESIMELSIASTEFAAKAVDFLVDMFNDSSDRVRLRATRALVAIGERSLINLTGEQLSIALSAMKDSSGVMREGIYAFLTVSLLPKSDSLSQLMESLKANLEKYPEDQLPIYQALKALGRHHSQMINASFVRQLLGISEHYLSREARIDDIVYAGNVILIMNTRRPSRQALASILPDYIFHHLSYLRDKYRGCLPDNIIDTVPQRLEFPRKMLERPHLDSHIAKLSLSDSQKSTLVAFTNIQETLKTLCHHTKTNSLKETTNGSHTVLCKPISLKRYIEDYDRLSDIAQAPSLSAHRCKQVVVSYSRLICRVLDTQQLLENVLQNTAVLEHISAIMYGSYEIEARTTGVDLDSRLALIYLRVFAHATWIHIHQLAQYDTRLVEKMQQEFIRRIRRVEKLSNARSTEIKELAILCNQITPQTTVSMQAVQEFILKFKPLLFSPTTGRCQYATAEFITSTAAQRTVEFNHLFPLNLKIHVSLEWIARCQDIVVSVGLPTQTCSIYKPPFGCIKPLSDMHWSLDWNTVPCLLPLGSGESTLVVLGIAIQQKADSPWSDSFIVKGDSVPVTYKVESYYKKAADNHQRYINVQIVDVGHTVNVNPVEFRPLASVHVRA